jgi:hypothetical protein
MHTFGYTMHHFNTGLLITNINTQCDLNEKLRAAFGTCGGIIMITSIDLVSQCHLVIHTLPCPLHETLDAFILSSSLFYPFALRCGQNLYRRSF